MKTLLAVACALFLNSCSDDAKDPVDAAPAKPDVPLVDAAPDDVAPVDVVLFDAVEVDDAVLEAAIGDSAKE